jgi:hypothetical protein
VRNTGARGITSASKSSTSSLGARADFDGAPTEAVQARWRRADDTVMLVKPLTFMNVERGGGRRLEPLLQD